MDESHVVFPISLLHISILRDLDKIIFHCKANYFTLMCTCWIGPCFNYVRFALYELCAKKCKGGKCRDLLFVLRTPTNET